MITYLHRTRDFLTSSVKRAVARRCLSLHMCRIQRLAACSRGVVRAAERIKIRFFARFPLLNEHTRKKLTTSVDPLAT